MIEVLLLLVLTLMIVAILITTMMVLALIGGVITEAPFVPTPRKVIPEALKLLNAQEGAKFYDLGCGNGRIVFAFARHNPHSTAIGVDKAPLPYLMALSRKLFEKNKNTEFLFQDFFLVNLKEATHIFLYLYPPVMDRLLPKFEKELTPGTRVVSCDFPFAKKASAQIELGSGWSSHTLYAYDF